MVETSGKILKPQPQTLTHFKPLTYSLSPNPEMADGKKKKGSPCMYNTHNFGILFLKLLVHLKYHSVF